MRRHSNLGVVGICAAGLAAVLLVVALSATPAWAGDWMQVSCVNPDGSAAPNEGWAGFASGGPNPWSYTDTSCGPGSPMTADLSAVAPGPTPSSEFLGYTPPAGSKLVGGTVDVNLAADGFGTDSSGQINADAVAALYEPELANSPSDLFLQCVAWLVSCSPGTADNLDYSGPVALPADRGGGFFAQAGCAGQNAACNTSAKNGAWALAQVVWAHLLLASNVAPQGSHFSGSALQRAANRTAHLVFTATDPGGPGVYSVTVKIDAKPVWTGVPNGNGGQCAPVGTDAASGAKMFDSQQPCLATEVVDVPVPTSGLSDGAHELSVTVTDAAQNSSTVLDQTINTSNPQTTPVPRAGRAVRARFVISWRWNGTSTLLRSIKVHRLPRNARLTVSCTGRRCPRLRVTSVSAKHASSLLRGLSGRRFRAGNRLRVTVTAPRHTAERIELRMRNNRIPAARLLKR